MNIDEKSEKAGMVEWLVDGSWTTAVTMVYLQDPRLALYYS